MEKLELNHKVENRRLVLELPEEFNNKHVHITVSEVPENEESGDTRKWSEIPAEERLGLLTKYMGTAKYPNFPIDKYDVYDQ